MPLILEGQIGDDTADAITRPKDGMNTENYIM